MGTTTITPLNCEGSVRNSEYIHSLLSSSSCDFLCLSETWLLNDLLHKSGSIHENYTFTRVSGMDSDKEILRGRPYGGTAILYKKHLEKICN